VQLSHGDLREKCIRSLLADRSQWLWVGCAHALVRYDGTVCRRYPLPDDEKGPLGVLFLSRSEHGLWVGTRIGPIEFDPTTGRFSVPPALLDPRTRLKRPVSVYGRVPGDRLVLGGPGVTFLFDTKTRAITELAIRYDSGRDRPDGPTGFAYAGDRLWIGTNSNGLISWDLTRKVEARYRTGDDALNITALEATDGGRLVVGALQGLFQFDIAVNRWTRLSSLGGENRFHVLSLHRDESGRVWVGTSSLGLYLMYPRSELSQVVSLPGTRLPPVLALASHASGRTVIGTRRGLFATRAPGGSMMFRTVRTEPKSWARAILPEPDGAIWIGTNADGLHRLEGRRRTRSYGREHGLPSGAAHVLLRDSKGTLWVGGFGLVRMHGERFEAVAIPVVVDRERPNAHSDVVSSLLEDARGRLWVTTPTAIHRLDQDRKTWHSLALPSMPYDGRMYADRGGAIWLCLQRTGLVRVDSELSSVTKKPLGKGWAVCLAGRGSSLWVATTYGLRRLDLDKGGVERIDELPGIYENLEIDASGRLWLTERDQIIRYDPATRDVRRMRRDVRPQTSAISRTSAQAQTGEIYVAFPDGVVSINDFVLSERRPNLALASIRVGEDEVRRGGKRWHDGVLCLEPGDDVISFAVAAPDLFEPERYEYSFRLAGLHKQFLDHGRQHRIDFGGLAEGSYRLLGRMRKDGGAWTDPTQLVSLAVAVPFWQRAVVHVLAVLGVVLGAGLYWARRAGLTRQNVDRLVEERTAALSASRDEAERLSELLNQIHSETHLEPLLREVLRCVIEVLPVDRGRILALEDGSGLFRFYAVQGWPKNWLETFTLSPDEARTIYLENSRSVRDDVYLLDGSAEPFGEGKGEVLVVALRVDVQPIGFLLLDSSDHWTENSVDLVASLVGPIARALDRSRKIEELTERNREKIELMGMAAHHLRDPLEVMTITASRLAEGIDPDSDDAAETLSSAVNLIASAHEMTELVDDLIDASTAEVSQFEIRPKVQDLVPVVCERVAAHRVSAEHKGIELHVELPSVPPQVRVDSKRIRAALDNLIGNAIKFTQPGGRIEVRWSWSKTELVTSIEDDGFGLDSVEMRRLFTRFGRVHASPSGEKTEGLGLAIVKRIIEQHGGSVWAKSRRGQGATFSFSLPVEPYAG